MERTAGAAETFAVFSPNVSIDPEEGGGRCYVGEHDVLGGKDKICYHHSGTMAYRKLIDRYFRDYQDAPRRDVKTQITTFIISEVHRRGGRFLVKPKGSAAWEVVEDLEKVHDKVSHALRTAKEPRSSRKSKQQESDRFHNENI
jgi:hypothetical protein